MTDPRKFLPDAMRVARNRAQRENEPMYVYCSHALTDAGLTTWYVRAESEGVPSGTMLHGVVGPNDEGDDS